MKVKELLKWVAIGFGGLIVFGIMIGVINGAKDTRIEVPDSSVSLKGKDYKSVQSKFKDAGFTNIKLLKIEDLEAETSENNGKVEEVTINGKNSFSNGSKYDKKVKIAISYHTFKDSEASNSKEELSLEFTEDSFITNENREAIITGKTSPGAEVCSGFGILGDKTIADKEGNFTLNYELSSDKKQNTVEITATLNGKSATKKVLVKQNTGSNSEASSSQPADVSDAAIQAIKTYNDYLDMYKKIMTSYLDDYHEAIKGTALDDEAAFNELKKGYEEEFESMKKEYGILGKAPLVGVKDTFVQMLITYRDSLKELTDSIK